MDQNTQGLYIHADVFVSAWSNVMLPVIMVVNKSSACFIHRAAVLELGVIPCKDHHK